MAHTIYHSEAVVLDSFDVGETDRVYIIFTKEFGLVHVFAKSVRAQASKLRPNMPLFSRNRVSFVLGRSFARLIDAEELESRSFIGAHFFTAGRMGRFLLRIIQGEERDIRIWGTISSAFRYLYALQTEGHKYPESALLSFELLFNARLLHQLGYVGDGKKEIEKLLYASEWGVSFAGSEQTALRSIVDRGMQASHL